MFQFRTRELLLLAALIALAIAVVNQRRGRLEIDYHNVEDARTVPGLAVETHYIVVKNSGTPLVLQLQEGTSDWRDIYDIGPREYLGFGFHTHWSTEPQNRRGVILTIQGKEMVLGELSTPTYIRGVSKGGDLVQLLTLKKPFYEVDWSDISGETKTIKLRLVYQ